MFFKLFFFFIVNVLASNSTIDLCVDYILLVEKNFVVPGTVVISNAFSNFTVLKLVCNSEETVLLMENSYKEILHIEEDMPVTTQGFLMNEQLDGTQWGLDEIDGVINDKYTYTLTGVGINVYVIDSGIYPNKDIALKIDVSRGVDLTGSNPPNPLDDCLGHGTHVSSTIAGDKYGVAKGVTLIPVRVFPCSGTASNSVIISAIDWVSNQLKPKEKAVINMSLGGPNSEILTQVAYCHLI